MRFEESGATDPGGWAEVLRRVDDDPDPIRAATRAAGSLAVALRAAGWGAAEARAVVLGRLSARFEPLGPGPRAAVMAAVAEGVDQALAERLRPPGRGPVAGGL